jgi:DDE superfamily endonuclease
MKADLDLYTDYLLSSTGQTSATGLSRLVDGEISHDSVTRFLGQNDFTSKSLWLNVKSLVRAHENAEGCLVFDDVIVEKEYTDENDLVNWHYDHAKGRGIKGVNLLTAFYVSQKDEKTKPLRVPVGFKLIQKPISFCDVKTKKEKRKGEQTKNEMMREMITIAICNQLLFKYVLADSWFASVENMTFINEKKKFFIFDMKVNRLAILVSESAKKPSKKSQWTSINQLDIPENTPVQVWLKDLDFPVLLVKQVFKNEDDSTQGCRFLVSNDLSLSYNDFATIYKKRWSVEEYHKSMKQNASIAKSPARTVQTQSNHLFCAIWAYVKLEKLKFQTNLNHFQLKAKIYLKALKAAFGELANIKAQAKPA